MNDGIEENIIAIYDRHGRTWAGLRGDRPTEGAWLDRFCRLLSPGATVLDIGCGSGVPIARALARRGFDVTGIDGSATMLTLFRENMPDTPALCADMRQLALDKRFGGLIAWDSFFHLSPKEQRSLFARFAAHAEPGAPLMFTSGPKEGSAIGELEGEPLYHGSLSPEEYRMRLDATGFAIVDHVAEDQSCGGRTIWLAQKRG